MNVLDRVNIEHYNDEMALERKRLLTAAATKLGYAPSNPTTLIYKLLNLGVVPFKTAQVEAYKKSKERHGLYSGTKGVLLHIAINIVATALAIADLCHFNNLPGNFASGMFFVGIILAVATGFSYLMLAPHWAEEFNTGYQTSITWAKASIPAYAGTIPDYVLNTALRIKEAIPAANLDINHLVEHQHYKQPRLLLDPFLVVSLGNETYYVEQWDERDLPRFDD